MVTDQAMPGHLHTIHVYRPKYDFEVFSFPDSNLLFLYSECVFSNSKGVGRG